MKEAGETDGIISSFSALSASEKAELIASLALILKEDVSQEKKEGAPLSIFDNERLSCLESVVKYMKENEGMKFSKIASALNRSGKTIWATYQKAAEKMPIPFSVSDSKMRIPFSNFSNREFTPLESLVSFLKDKGMSNHEAAVAIRRDDRTVWTVWDRVKRKRGLK
ncbi:hypothetical protein J4212_03675 [Candidatus Woesearchaeota archaeon]|nr:hypothetical protein [Candidatus Woesearchaeota archaeon]